MTFSQNGEDKIILDYFGSSLGCFLDIGANDGITLSNTRALALKGWVGTCVEPAPSAWKKLSMLYEQSPIEVFNVAIGTKTGQITLHESGEHLGKNDTALLSTIVESEKSRWVKETFTPVQVDCITVDTLLILSKYKRFNFVSIDAEGMDFDILRQMPLKQMGVECLCIEWNGKEKEKYTTYMEGYRLIHENFENLIFAL